MFYFSGDFTNASLKLPFHEHCGRLSSQPDDDRSHTISSMDNEGAFIRICANTLPRPPSRTNEIFMLRKYCVRGGPGAKVGSPHTSRFQNTIHQIRMSMLHPMDPMAMPFQSGSPTTRNSDWPERQTGQVASYPLRRLSGLPAGCPCHFPFGKDIAERPDGRHHPVRIVTVPRSPFTEMICPLLTRCVTSSKPSTAGMPCSRATMKMCSGMLSSAAVKPSVTSLPAEGYSIQSLWRQSARIAMVKTRG